MNYRICFASYLRRQGRRPATVRSYSHAVAEFRAYCRPAGKRDNIRRQMQPGNLKKYRDYLLSRSRLHPSTINRRLTALSAFARFLQGRGILDYNPLELVERVGSNGKCRRRSLASWENVQHLRREADRDLLDLQGRLIVELLYTGMTVRELYSLRWDGQAAGDFLRAGERKIMLHPEARLALHHYLILRPILLGGYLIVGDGEEWSLKASTVYTLLRRLSHKIDAPVGVSSLRLARFVRLAGVTAPVPAAMEESAA